MIVRLLKFAIGMAIGMAAGIVLAGGRESAESHVNGRSI